MDNQQPTNVTELKVAPRAESGKGHARKLRKAGMIPGVFYGLRTPPAAFACDPNDLRTALKTRMLKNTLIKIVAEGSDINGRVVMVKEIQRHPLSRSFLHVDLIEVYADRMVKIMVPITLVGVPKGLELGGVLEHNLRSVHVKCVPDKIPVDLSIDVSALEIGHFLKLKDVAIPEGVNILDDLNMSVASVIAPRLAEVTAAEAEAAAAAEAEAAGEEGAAPDADKAKGADKGKGDKAKGEADEKKK